MNEQLKRLRRLGVDEHILEKILARKAKLAGIIVTKQDLEELEQELEQDPIEQK